MCIKCTIPGTMNALERYFEDVEKAPKLAARVGCSHTTLYRIAAGKTRASRKIARLIEAETGGAVTRAVLYAIADHSPADGPQAIGDGGVALAGGEGAQEQGEVEGGVAVHGATVTPAADPGQREPFPQDAAAPAEGQATP